MSKKLSIYLAILFLIAVISVPFNNIVSSEDNTGRILYVDNDGTVEYTKIQNAVDNASENDVVYVYNGIYLENIFLNKSINLIGEDKDKTIINGNLNGSVVSIFSEKVNISGFTIKNSGHGIKIGGIYLESNYNTIYNNNIENNNDCGIFLWESSKNKIFDNFIYNNGDDGIYIGKNSDHNNICNNNISKNSFSGLYIGNSSHNIIKNNKIKNNTRDGMSLYSSADENLILNNNITKNRDTGIRLFQSSNNTLYRNNLIDNNQNANDSYSNFWFADNISSGNYWDDYTGRDNDNDGIGDIPYDIPGGNNKDKYPLMKPYHNRSIEIFQVDRGTVINMLFIGMILVILFVLPIAYYWRKKYFK